MNNPLGCPSNVEVCLCVDELIGEKGGVWWTE